ncbi:hypothetical protein FCL54_14770 [Pseudalkalibacillus caeni]|uniref:RNA polymerase sigma-70 region 4 domain-containing protein n=2 Tax=Exobacillus caeni TaxID=2574798 RepID=A0A5R9F0N9_9BACL|nr:hypothetical protein FCL54_14770 [Pseudalkalibacillus caeni]
MLLEAVKSNTLYGREDQVSASNCSVDMVFEENKYNSFRRFCHKKGINYIGEITEENLEEYSNSKGVGRGRLNVVKERLEEYSALPEPSPDAKLYNSVLPISDVIIENKYALFRRFCEAKNITRLNEITLDHLEEFSRTPGVGKKKFEDIKTILKNNSSENPITNVVEFQSSQLFEYLKDYKVRDLMVAFKVEGEIHSPLTLNEIEGKKIEDVNEYLPTEMLMELKSKLKKAKHPSILAEDVQSTLQENQYRILHYRYGDKLTLEETGQYFNVTRERVRQIAKKAEKKVYWYLAQHYFYAVSSLLSTTKTFITREELLNLLGSGNEYLIEILKDGTGSLTYTEMLDVFFFTHAKKINFEAIDEFIADLPAVFYFSEFESSLEEVLESLGIQEPDLPMITALLQYFGFKSYGQFYSRKNLTVLDVLEILFSNFLTKPLRIDEEGFVHLQHLANKYLNYRFDCSLRALDARLRYSNKIILTDSSTFMWFDDESFNQSLVSEIGSYLSERFKNTDVVNIEEVFTHFKKKLEELGIETKLHLYSIIKYYLDEEYTIGKGNTLNIFPTDSDKLNIEDSLLRAIEEFGGYCGKSELMEKLRWQQYKIDLGISNSNKMMSWGTNKVITFERLGITPEEKSLLIELTERSMAQAGYITMGALLKEMKFNPQLSPLVNSKGIDDSGKLAAVLKVLMPELKGHSNFLYNDGCEFTSFEEVIIDHFDRETTRQELQDFAVENGYKPVMAATLLKRLLNQRAFIEIDMGVLYPATKINVTESIVTELVDFVEQARAGKEYVSLSKLKGYKRRLPSIGLRWNAHLMKSILVEHGYRQITKIMSDYRYDKIVLVKKESPITSFEELVHFILKNEYEGNMHERNVYDFLVERGIVREQDSPSSKVLPHELKNIDNLVNVDNLGIVSLR